MIYTNLLYLSLALSVVSYFLARTHGLLDPMTLIVSSAAVISVIVSCSVKENAFLVIKS